MPARSLFSLFPVIILGCAAPQQAAVGASERSLGPPGAQWQPQATPPAAAPTTPKVARTAQPAPTPPKVERTAQPTPTPPKVERTARPEPTAAEAERTAQPSAALPFDPSNPLADCQFEEFASGWVTGTCNSFSLYIYAGFAAKSGAVHLRNVTEDRLDAYDSVAVPIRLRGASAKAWELTARQRKVVKTMFGEERRIDPNGRPLRRALFAKVRTPKSGRVGVVCFGDAAVYDRATCRRAIDSVATRGLPTGPRPERDLKLAGKKLRLIGKRCWAPRAREVYCYLDGGLTWSRGSEAEMQAWLEQRIRSTGLAPLTEAERQEAADALNEQRDTILAHKQIAELRETGEITTMEAPTYTAADIQQRRVARHLGRCRIAGVERECVRVDLYGVLAHPARYQYFAFVEEDGEVTALECSHDHSEPAPTPCREIFGSFVVRPSKRPTR